MEEKNWLKKILEFGWQGIQVWSALTSLGATSMIAAIVRHMTSWSWQDQTLLFGGIFIVILGVLAAIISWRELKDSPIKIRHASNQNKKTRRSKLTYEEITVRSAFARALKVVVERLRLNANGSYTNSASRIFFELHSQLKTEIDKHILASQAQHLLLKEFMSFDSETLNLEARVNELASAMPSDTDISSFCTGITRLLGEYRQLIKELMTFLGGLKQEGVKPIWEAEPWLTKIYVELASDYDRLVVLIKDLRKDTPEKFRSTLPSESGNLLDNFKKASAIEPN